MFKSIAVILIILLFHGCAPKAPEITPEPVTTEKTPYGPVQPMKELLSSSYAQQYSPVQSVFEPRREPDYSKMILLSRERPEIILADDVTAYALQGDVLAAGFSGGHVRIWSGWPCAGFDYSSDDPVQNIWMGGYSPFVAVSSGNQQEISIFDLRSCTLRKEITTQGPVQNITVSSDASRIALVDEGRRLWTGSPGQTLEHRETLRYNPLAMSFTPKGGVLMVVDEAGWLVKWTVPEYEMLESFLIPDGPFEVARFKGSSLVLDKRGNPGSAVVWNIPAGQLDADNTARGEYLLENKVLYYILHHEELVKRVFMSAPELQVQIDPEKMAVKVRDLDGRQRYFNARTGEEIEEFESYAGFKDIQVQPTGVFSWADTDYSLADPVMSSKDSTLWSRYIPDQGHYLWWTADRDRQSGTFQQRLPLRRNIRAEIPPDWVDID